MKHIQYALYVFKHKCFVFVEACKLRILLRGILHDLSKFLPDEWFPYAAHFYGKARDEGKGYDRSHDLDDPAFNLAWLKHIHRNKHHWQYWLLQFDDGSARALPMPDKYRREMLADWRGAGRAQGFTNTLEWYKRNKHNMILHPETRYWIENALMRR